MIQRVFMLSLQDGRCPIRNWLDTLMARSKDHCMRIIRRIDRLERGNFGHYRRIREISELKLDVGPGYRVYFGTIGNAAVVLLIGGDKSTQTSDIHKAEEMWTTFKRAGTPGEQLIAWEGEDDDDD